MKTKYRSKTLITIGFSTILLLLLALLSLWINAISENTSTIDGLHKESEEMQLISIMRDSAHKRSIKLYQMTTVEDPFDRDEIYMEIRDLGGKFIAARDKFLTSELDPLRQSIWDKAKQSLTRGGNLQHQVANLVFNDEIAEAQNILKNEVIPAQTQFMENLDALLAASTSVTSDSIHAVSDKNSATYRLIYLLGMSALLLGMFTIFVVRRTEVTEKAFLEQGERIKALYEVSARADLSPDEQINETLRLGCRLLDMEIGKIGKLDPGTNTSEFLNTIAPPELPIKRGKILPLDKTYCNLTFNSPGPIALHHVGSSEYKDDISYQFLGMEAYIGTTIHVNGEKFGTVHFVNRKPRKKPFSDTDKDMLNLIGSWVAVTFERQLAQEELKKSKEEAEAANKSKSAFLANMSHEIRTPLTAIIGYSEMLKDEEQSEEERQHEVDSIIRSGAHLQRIINDILDLSKIEAGQLVIEQIPTSPFQVVNEIESIMGKRARDKGIDFNVNYEYPIPKKISTDPTRFKQIILNIVGNAIKFTSEGSININVKYLQDERKISLIIKDTGIGMSHEEMDRLFKPFSQADASTTREYGGTGLGLCISKQLANNLGGDVEFDSEKGKGSTFNIKIDIGSTEVIELVNELEEFSDTPVNETIKHENISLVGRKVLFAEDNPDTQQLVSIYIRKTGASTSIAANGEEAVEMALSEDFDMVLMDIQMPVMDGLDATRLLREKGYDKPIIALTANAMKEDKDRCIAAGANDYLTKPIDLQNFYYKLKKYIGSPVDKQAGRTSVTNILNTISNDPQYQQLEKNFLGLLPEYMNDIDKALETSDWAAILTVVNNLKANGGEFGAHELSNLAEVIYVKLTNKNYDSLSKNLESLRALCNKISSENTRKVS